jgi:invasion protein IalB
MRRKLLLLPLFVCAFVSTSAFAQSPPVIFSPWMKICLKHGDGATCVTEKVSRSAQPCGDTVASVALIEQSGDPIATLRMSLPRAVDQHHGAEILIDQDQPIARPFKQCLSAGLCMVEHQARASDLVSRLKSGRVIAVQGVDANSQPLTGRFSLEGFAEAYDGTGTALGPPSIERRRECDSNGCYFDDPEFEKAQQARQALQNELQRCAEEARKKLEGQGKKRDDQR